MTSFESKCFFHDRTLELNRSIIIDVARLKTYATSCTTAQSNISYVAICTYFAPFCGFHHDPPRHDDWRQFCSGGLKKPPNQ